MKRERKEKTYRYKARVFRLIPAAPTGWHLHDGPSGAFLETVAGAGWRAEQRARQMVDEPHRFVFPGAVGFGGVGRERVIQTALAEARRGTGEART